ncbi:hypothetical protein [Pseudoalteromonas distincta]|uniref:Uncharacterized protein n=1 Tax=Pseudoalteromonas distincta TaxID=77608 RepID=A0A4P9J067_9GAMM|nr:hypothetical protein [Pseudoalteromonas distincta]QCU74220.1 hypothetical protein FFU37_06955 [Pseudoalteromonas distincta]
MLYELIKDIFVPILSPTIAIVTLILVAVKERDKIRIQKEQELESQINSIERELFSIRETYELLGIKIKNKEEIEEQRVVIFRESFERFFSLINNSPFLYESYFSLNKKHINPDRLPLLLPELHARLCIFSQKQIIDKFILFSLYILLYARKKENEDLEEVKIINDIFKVSPELYSAWWNENA